MHEWYLAYIFLSSFQVEMSGMYDRLNPKAVSEEYWKLAKSLF